MEVPDPARPGWVFFAVRSFFPRPSISIYYFGALSIPFTTSRGVVPAPVHTNGTGVLSDSSVTYSFFCNLFVPFSRTRNF